MYRVWIRYFLHWLQLSWNLDREIDGFFQTAIEILANLNKYLFLVSKIFQLSVKKSSWAMLFEIAQDIYYIKQTPSLKLHNWYHYNVDELSRETVHWDEHHYYILFGRNHNIRLRCHPSKISLDGVLIG